MRFYCISLLLLLLFVINVVCKGGGGGGRGGGGGGRGGSGSSGSGRGSSPAGSRSPGGGIAAGGGSGAFNGKSPPSYSSSTSRQTFTNYNPTNAAPYGSGRYSGYYGTYQPGFPYFFVFPSFMFIGYYGAYHRYNNQGAYYAPQMSSQGSGSSNIMVNGTAYPSDDDNYHYTINVIARNDQFPTIDMSYFASSDLATTPADFIYRLTLTHIVEYDDLNNNGFYDAQEPILATSSLQKLNWQPMILNNRTVSNNADQTYLETMTGANVTFNSTAGNTFGINLTLRFTNLQLNSTADIPLQPNSVQYDIQLANYPSGARTAVNPRVSLAQVITTKPFTATVTDVNVTTPVDIARQIKTNVTYGVSVGNYSEGRLEYQTTVNITNLAGISTTLGDPDQVDRGNDPYLWGWGQGSRVNNMLLVTMNSGGGNLSNSYKLSGLAFLDTDIINSAINNGGDGAILLSSGTKWLPALTGLILLAMSI
ncbi:hypothetical protein BC941DRAFT_437598 [Chlamydoabsidia padenii]|nr:hypothetical protein BC941DRAFT_437598 [Chlamydoabsidia padenii]